MNEKYKRYELLCKEVNYIMHFISNWEVFDFDNLQTILNEMKELQSQFNTKDNIWI